MSALLQPYFSAAASPLFAKAFPLPQKAIYPEHAHKTIFFGTGLVTPKALSEGLPFDYLSMVTAAETLRRDLADTRTARILHYIPDVTARQNNFASLDALETLATRTAEIALKIADRLGLKDHYHVIRGSEIENDPYRKGLLELAKEYAAATDVPAQFQGYLAEQLADMAFLGREKSVKVSWTMARNPDSAAKGLDESFFDSHYAKFLYGAEVDFAYIQPGRRLDAKANRACPYTAVTGEPRLSLTNKFSTASAIERAGLKQDSDVAKDAIKYWGQIVDELEELFDLTGLPQKPAPLSQKPDADDVKRYRADTIQRIDATRSKMGEILSL